ncbi:transmembrane protein, putative (macronuclear) [Tetrahymena thermophila SB210]|uniref:Transmembrane protein, putative n=1 Tax=Tetrahymena thermophila (strain SB210) TaxID=312017 RepID=Q23TC3_TETTS|nr:transmembrane protein, putative [Tetrahymena thermophila SB210]EAR99783.2 transmembrane protein, putative [Tetrahymena thermophila SB210]|eukprot:XP_001020028.2 transmembrane protein, putative [Tetrahymena thermophila SB210]
MIARLKEVSKKPETFKYTAALSLIIFLFLQFNWTTIVTLTLILASLVQLLRIQYFKLQERGFISLLPRTLQVHLLDRSIFDLLCDIWYIPKISLYIKAFLKPFVQNISPEEAACALQELPDSAKRAIMTKGLINFLPNFMQSAIMPQQNQEVESNNMDNTNLPYLKQRYIDEDNEDQDSLGSTNTTKSTKFQAEDDLYYNIHRNLDNNIFIAPHAPKHPLSALIQGNDYQDKVYQNDYQYKTNNNNNNNTQYSNKQQRNASLKEITIDEKRDSSLERRQPIRSLNKNAQHEFSFNNNLFKLSQNEPNTFIKSQDNKAQKNVRWSNHSLHQSTSSEDEHLLNSSSQNFYDIFHNRGALSDEELPKTKLIASSSAQIISSSEDISKSPSSSQKLKPKIADKWDKLELFRNKIKENYQKFIQIKHNPEQGANITNKPNLISSARSILNLFHNIMELKKMGNLSNIDNKKLLKIFIASSIFMGAQVMTSRRARRWMINSSLMLLYIFSFLLTTGTLGIIAVKYHHEQQQKQILNKKVVISKQNQNKDEKSNSN